ncbi:hypothetical protein MRX96_031037 [Rhipicephalus microplus]
MAVIRGACICDAGNGSELAPPAAAPVAASWHSCRTRCLSALSWMEKGPPHTRAARLQYVCVPSRQTVVSSQKGGSLPLSVHTVPNDPREGWKDCIPKRDPALLCRIRVPPSASLERCVDSLMLGGH